MASVSPVVTIFCCAPCWIMYVISMFFSINPMLGYLGVFDVLKSVRRYVCVHPLLISRSFISVTRVGDPRRFGPVMC